MWDRFLFDGARTKVLGPTAATLRAVMVSGGELDQTSPVLGALRLEVSGSTNISFCSGPIESKLLTPSRIALSVPVVNILSHPLVTGPVFASHAFDLQDFITEEAKGQEEPAHSGPPTINIEVKLVGVDDEAIEGGADPEGVVFIRGPPVGKLVNVEDYVDVHVDEKEEGEGWVGTGLRAKVLSNGAFVVL